MWFKDAHDTKTPTTPKCFPIIKIFWLLSVEHCRRSRQIQHCSQVRLRSWCLISFTLCLSWSDPKPLTGVCTAQTRCLQIASCLAMLQGKGPVTTLLGSSSSEQPAFPLNCMCLHKRRGCLEASLAEIRGELDHTLICFKIFDYFCPRARNRSLLTCAILPPTCSWWTETHSGIELAEPALLPACREKKKALQIVTKAGVSRKSAASLCIASGGKYCTQSLFIGRETRLWEHSLSLELLPTESIDPSDWDSYMDVFQGQTSHYST